MTSGKSQTKAMIEQAEALSLQNNSRFEDEFTRLQKEWENEFYPSDPNDLSDQIRAEESLTTAELKEGIETLQKMTKEQRKELARKLRSGDRDTLKRWVK